MVRAQVRHNHTSDGVRAFGSFMPSIQLYELELVLTANRNGRVYEHLPFYSAEVGRGHICSGGFGTLLKFLLLLILLAYVFPLALRLKTRNVEGAGAVSRKGGASVLILQARAWPLARRSVAVRPFLEKMWS